MFKIFEDLDVFNLTWVQNIETDTNMVTVDLDVFNLTWVQNHNELHILTWVQNSPLEVLLEDMIWMYSF